MSATTLDRPGAATSPTPAHAEADRAERERLRSDAERWLAALPIRTVLRRPPRGTGERGHPRLAMYRTAAGSPEFWEKTWLVSPPYRMRGYTLPTWYRDAFTRWLPSDGLIIEAGCGNGNLLRMLANHDPARWGNFAREPQKGACVEGLDFAPNAIAENRRIHPEGCYRVGDVRDLPYQTGGLSGYISMGVVEHFGEPERAVILREAARTLRPGGVAIITVPSLSPARRLRASLGGFADESTIDRSKLDFYQFYFTRREIAGQIEAAGLRAVAFDGYDCRRGFADAFGERAGRVLDRLARGSAWMARRIDHPPRPVRRFCPHMLMVVAIKPW
ncbi:MAG: class I SAM-dependent methyltransferase [Phycisphaerales bacterium]|nr:class I SAM-dependent methyltransferase [Phycisphaerales bacterium]